MDTTIFKGTTLKPFREYISQQAIKTKASKIILPCAGRMTTAENMVANGIPASSIYASDITLYSSIIGYYFDDEKSVRDLGVVLNGITPRDDTDEEFLACVLFALKSDQFNKTKPYDYAQWRKLMTNKEKYLDDIKKALEEKRYLKGLHYEIADVREVVRREYAPDVLLYVNPPLYAGGYQKMFPYNSVTWNAPEISFFDEDSFDALIMDMASSEATMLSYAKDNTDRFIDMHTVFAFEQKKGRVDYLVCNKPLESAIVAKNPKMPISKYAIYHDEDITPDTRVDIVQVNHETAMYYRDLFIHKLGTTKAERYFLFLLDGKVVTSFGLSMRDVNTGKSAYVGEVFGISITSKKYKRLGKLFMLCLTSKDFQHILQNGYSMGFREIKGVKTSSITTHPEGKTDRSVMKLTFREQLKDGRWRVVYQTDWWDRGFKESIEMWLDKWGGVKRK